MAYKAPGVTWRGREYDDRGDIILGWFTRVAVFLLLLGIIAFELISLASARVNASGVANDIAIAAADAYAPRKSVKAAYTAAELKATESSVELVEDEFTISEDGSVDVAITSTATTLFLYRTSQTAKWAVIKSSGHASSRFRR